MNSQPMQYSNYMSPLVLTCLIVSANAYGEHRIDTRGFTWGGIRTPSSSHNSGKDNFKIEGALDQSLVTYKLTPTTQINYFLRLGYTADSKRIEDNNKISLSPGVKLSHSLSDNASLSFGVMYKYEYRGVAHTDNSSPVYFIDWWGGWSLDCASCGNGNSTNPISLPGNTWGNIRTPSELTEDEDGNVILEGAIEQGIIWNKSAAGALNSFVDIAYKTDTKGIDWNNSIEIGLGIKLEKQLSKNLSISYGVKYSAEREWLTDDGWNKNATVFLNWSAGWSGL
jgi:hypothetical protein